MSDDGVSDNGVSGERFTLTAGTLTLQDLRSCWEQPRPLDLAPASYDAIRASAETVAAVVAEGRTVYGITTGFGSLARQTISADQVAELQSRLVRSHSTGVGAALDDRVVRLILLTKINALARGHSGIRAEVIDRLILHLNEELYPVIPAKGSVGASGDLAPLAHLSGVLLGEGQIRQGGPQGGQIRPAAAVMAERGLAPIELAAKEGLALLNGTQVSTALALHGLFQAERIFAAALAAGALSVDAALGSDTPFDPRIHSLRGHDGQIDVAAGLRDLLADSEIRQSHLDCDRVQDPYSLRCQPQVMGAALDVMRSTARCLVTEANAVSDNPLVFPDSGEVLSGGNFHAEPVAFAADMLAMAMAEIGALSERRTALLVDATMSTLPAFLVAEPGLNSGFMIAHVTAAALASENKMLSHPASVDSLPTSANQEDHVSMAAHGARRLSDIAQNVGHIVAIELMAAAQGIDLRRPLKTSPKLTRAMEAVRARAAFLEDDRLLAPDIEALADLVLSDWFPNRLLEADLLS